MQTAVIAAPPPTPYPPGSPIVRTRLAAHRLAGWAALGLVATVVALAGLDLRYWAWQATEPIRYVMDIDNAFRQGSRTLQTGYVERYDNNNAIDAEPSWGPSKFGLDYGPGRLAVATLWTHWVRSQVPPPTEGLDRFTDQWRTEFYPYAREQGRTYALCQPLLLFNLTGEAMSAIAMFLLVRRYASAWGTRPVRGNVLALVSVTLFWLDPALLSNAHAWPQWDSWVLPFTLWALLLASLDWWFCAGVAIAMGAMFKGQVLFGAAIFLLWPLRQGRFGAMGRWIAGLAFGVATETAVWLVRSPGTMHGFLYEPGHTNPAAVHWVLNAALAAVLILVAVRARGDSVRRATPSKWSGWTTFDPHGHHIAAGVVALMAGLGATAILLLAALWLAIFVSVGLALIIGAIALALLAWTAWMIGALPAHWPNQLAEAPWAVSIAIRLAIGIGAVALVIVSLHPAVVPVRWWCCAIGVVVLALLAWWVPARSLGHVAAAWVAGSLLFCLPLFGGSSQWFDVGIAHGTTARNRMSNGDNNNLANLMEDLWGWQLDDPVITLPTGKASANVGTFLHAIDKHVVFPPGKPVTLPLKYLLVLIWVTATVACAFAAARHDRHRDAKFLIAVAAPWIVMFAVMGQMHQRYLLWGAALTCMAAGVNPGLVLLHILLSVVSMGQEFISMVGTATMTDRRDTDQILRDLTGDPNTSTAAWWVRTFYRASTGATPSMGWAVILTACVFVYVAVTPSRRRGTVTGR